MYKRTRAQKMNKIKITQIQTGKLLIRILTQRKIGSNKAASQILLSLFKSGGKLEPELREKCVREAHKAEEKI